METNPVGFRERRRSGEQGEGGEGGWHIPGGMAAPGSQLLPKVLPQLPRQTAELPWAALAARHTKGWRSVPL